jgi:Haem-binding domain
MLKIIKWFSIALVGILVCAQFVRPARTNPQSDEARAIHSSVEMTPEVSAILSRACYDCHSNGTKWPWYSEVAPVSWFVINHVTDGRRHLNFSEWGGYDQKKASRKMHEIDEQVSESAMPLSSYTMLHPEARLSDEDRTVLSAWARAASQRIEVAANAANR